MFLIYSLRFILFVILLFFLTYYSHSIVEGGFEETS